MGWVKYWGKVNLWIESIIKLRGHYQGLDRRIYCRLWALLDSVEWKAKRLKIYTKDRGGARRNRLDRYHHRNKTYQWKEGVFGQV